jgi:hypothetical protein
MTKRPELFINRRGVTPRKTLIFHCAARRLVRILTEARVFFSSACPYSLVPNGYRGLTHHDVKRLGRINLPTHPIKKARRHTSNYQYVFETWCLINQSFTQSVMCMQFRIYWLYPTLTCNDLQWSHGLLEHLVTINWSRTSRSIKRPSSLVHYSEKTHIRFIAFVRPSCERKSHNLVNCYY